MGDDSTDEDEDKKRAIMKRVYAKVSADEKKRKKSAQPADLLMTAAVTTASALGSNPASSPTFPHACDVRVAKPDPTRPAKKQRCNRLTRGKLPAGQLYPVYGLAKAYDMEIPRSQMALADRFEGMTHDHVRAWQFNKSDFVKKNPAKSLFYGAKVYLAGEVPMDILQKVHLPKSPHEADVILERKDGKVSDWGYDKLIQLSDGRIVLWQDTYQKKNLARKLGTFAQALDKVIEYNDALFPNVAGPRALNGVVAIADRTLVSVRTHECYTRKGVVMLRFDFKDVLKGDVTSVGDIEKGATVVHTETAWLREFEAVQKSARKTKKARGYQTLGVNAAWNATSNKDKSVFIHFPTGSGKSLVAHELMKKFIQLFCKERAIDYDYKGVPKAFTGVICVFEPYMHHCHQFNNAFIDGQFARQALGAKPQQYIAIMTSDKQSKALTPALADEKYENGVRIFYFCECTAALGEYLLDKYGGLAIKDEGHWRVLASERLEELRAAMMSNLLALDAEGAPAKDPRRVALKANFKAMESKIKEDGQSKDFPAAATRACLPAIDSIPKRRCVMLTATPTDDMYDLGIERVAFLSDDDALAHKPDPAQNDHEYVFLDFNEAEGNYSNMRPELRALLDACAPGTQASSSEDHATAPPLTSSPRAAAGPSSTPSPASMNHVSSSES